MTGTPACWEWSVTETHRTQAAALAGDDFPEARELLMAWQNGRCALCGYRRDRLIADHCHQTALVRGMLCQSCNVIEGRAGRQGPNTRIQGYRSKHPAFLLGLRVIYHNLHGPAVPEPALLDPDAEETHDAVRRMFEQPNNPNNNAMRGLL
jgi:hypothetical protein